MGVCIYTDDVLLKSLKTTYTSQRLNCADHDIRKVLIFLRVFNFADGQFRNILKM